MNTDNVFVTTRYDRVCSDPNRERPKRNSTRVSENSVCIKLEEQSDLRYPMSYVLWTDSLTGESGMGWILSSTLRSIHLL